MTTRRSLKLHRYLLTAALVLSSGLFPAGCNSSNPTEPDSAASGRGSLTLKMVDLPTDEICQLWMYFEGLKVKRMGWQLNPNVSVIDISQ